MLFRLLFAAALGASLLAAPASAQVRLNPAPASAPVQRALSFAAAPGELSGALVLPLASAEDLASRGAALDESERAAISRALASARFSYRARQTLSLRGVGGWDQILVIGLGERTDGAHYQMVGAVAGRALLSEPGAVTVLAGGLSDEAAAEFATGMGLGEYRSDLYAAGRRSAEPLAPTLIVTEAAGASALYARRGRALIEAMAWTRDLSNEPANVIYPESFVTRARAAFAGIPGVSIQVFDVREMERLGMGAILGVGRGSERPPRMLIVRYRGPDAPEGGPIVLAGKGITFDSGGLSIKTGTGMNNMRMDMSGAASVMGATLALARSRAPVNVVAIAALAENMPDGAAIRVGDVLTAMNGTTIEIGNTDAEGRLVLADAIAWAEANLDPAAIVDVATLTGAIVGALGPDYAGLFSRHDFLAAQLIAAGESTGEPLWRMPLHASYAGRIASTYADLINSGEAGPGAGMGAQFIGSFVGADTPWAHIDIAGVAWSGASDWKPAGSSGFAVRLLERFVLDWRPPAGE